VAAVIMTVPAPAATPLFAAAVVRAGRRGLCAAWTGSDRRFSTNRLSQPLPLSTLTAVAAALSVPSSAVPALICLLLRLLNRLLAGEFRHQLSDKSKSHLASS
jgi:hypothetical protein